MGPGMLLKGVAHTYVTTTNVKGRLCLHGPDKKNWSEYVTMSKDYFPGILHPRKLLLLCG